MVRQNCYAQGEKGRNFIVNKEENKKSCNNSLLQLSMVEIRFALDLSSKATLKGFI